MKVNVQWSTYYGSELLAQIAANLVPLQVKFHFFYGRQLRGAAEWERM